jgi:hypothetical protein
VCYFCRLQLSTWGISLVCRFCPVVCCAAAAVVVVDDVHVVVVVNIVIIAAVAVYQICLLFRH